MDKQKPGAPIVMEREVKAINGSTFVISSFSAKDATETLYELLKRVTIANAEAEFKKRAHNRGHNPQKRPAQSPKD